MLHRIDYIDPARIYYNEHLKISPDYLEDLLKYAKSLGCSFVSLDELQEIITKRKKARKIISVTLDDGYRDNFTNGLAVFKSLDVPFCIYVATGMVEKQFIYWWYVLEDLILANHTLVINEDLSFDCSTPEKKEKAFLDIREIILKMPQKNLKQELLSFFNLKEIPDYDLSLTWKQVLDLTKEPLATIGCHTHSHFSFKGCSTEEIKEDIFLSMNLIKEKTNHNMRHFAFPFGEEAAVDKSHIKLLRQLNFSTCATTRHGYCRYNTDLHALPRLFLTEKVGRDIIHGIANNV
ncbi:polysaccharide deacetylase [Alphaproteobacteria bacterium]|nr:polysaccharide deacetylase [Alphaproteobacteria bacterium]